MANFFEVHDDIQESFSSFINEIDGLREVKIKILSNPRLKEIGKVVKANDLLKHMTDEDVIIILNENVFEQLLPEQQSIVIDGLIAQIYFDAEKEKVVLVKPDVYEFSLLLAKYGYEQYAILKARINDIFAEIEEEAIINAGK